jgi:hypothetical protein
MTKHLLIWMFGNSTVLSLFIPYSLFTSTNTIPSDVETIILFLQFLLRGLILTIWNISFPIFIEWQILYDLMLTDCKYPLSQLTTTASFFSLTLDIPNIFLLQLITPLALLVTWWI